MYFLMKAETKIYVPFCVHVGKQIKEVQVRIHVQELESENNLH